MKTKSFCAIVLSILIFSLFSFDCAAQVAAGGSFTHRIPLPLTPPAVGPAPRLSLIYDSNLRNNGVAGVGWKLEGLPYIQRISPKDGTGDVLSERFVSHDGPLVGVNSHGDKTRYLPQNGLNNLYTRTRLNHGSPQGAPDEWKMLDAEGGALTFAAIPLSNPCYSSDGSARPKDEQKPYCEDVSSDKNVKVWAATSFKDTRLGSWKVDYDMDVYGDAGDKGGYPYPRTITYNKKLYRIVFYYEDRPSSDAAFARFSGAAIAVKRRLKRVDFETLSGGSWSAAHSLKLHYRLSSFKRSLLTGIDSLGNDGKTYASKTFEYDDQGTVSVQSVYLSDSKYSLDQNYRQISGDFDGDGRTDIAWKAHHWIHWEVRFGAGGKTNLPGLSDMGLSKSLQALGDFDGDGRTDIAWRKDNWTYWKFAYGQSSYDASRVGTLPDSTSGFAIPSDSKNLRQAVRDFNGDGKSDIALATCSSTEWRVAYGGGKSGTLPAATGTGDCGGNHYRQVVGDFDGDGRTDIAWRKDNDAAWTIAYGDGRSGTLPGDIDTQGDDYRQAVGDFDGDGRTDIAWRKDNWTEWKIARGDGSSGVMFGSIDEQGSDYHQAVGDFDGDGKTEVAWTKDSWREWKLNDGRTLPRVYSQSMTCAFHYVSQTWYQAAVGDFDGDGRDDIAMGRHCWDKWQISYGTGVSGTLNGGILMGDNFRMAVGDFDGDGRTDIAWKNQKYDYISAAWIYTGLAVGQSERLAKITGQSGLLTTVQYQPLKNFSGAVGFNSGAPGRVNNQTRWLVKETTVKNRAREYRETYDYFDGRLKTDGDLIEKADLGFARVERIDHHRQIKTVVKRRQDYPFHNQTDKLTGYLLPSMEKLTETSSDYISQTPYVSQSKIQRVLTSRTEKNGWYLGTKTSSETRTIEYEQHGLPLKITSCRDQDCRVEEIIHK